MILCWDPVQLDCNGGPELEVSYRYEAAYVSSSGEPPKFQLITGQTIDPCLPDLPDPPSGDVLIIKTTAIDGAGNEDCGL